jgi:hypothetical protein
MMIDELELAHPRSALCHVYLHLEIRIHRGHREHIQTMRTYTWHVVVVAIIIICHDWILDTVGCGGRWIKIKGQSSIEIFFLHYFVVLLPSHVAFALFSRPLALLATSY